MENAEKIWALLEADSTVVLGKYPLTRQFSPNDVLLNLDIQFREELSPAELAIAVDRLEKSIRKACPEINQLFIELQPSV